MPIYAPCHLIQSSPGEAREIVAKAKILVVEDDDNILNLLSAYLESAGCEVVAHQDSNVGFKAAFTDTFDICIVDIMLLNKFGIEIAEAMRAQGT
ncbi:MAG: response regulator, partial [Alphaproteobacteria bacterium]|nr:response regulator [Alphaproteobacteria bacterium]